MGALNASRILLLPLTESQRLEYLQVLGIDSYFPRIQMPGAPVSELVMPAPVIQEELAADNAPVDEHAPALKKAPPPRQPDRPAPSQRNSAATPAPVAAEKPRAREEIRLQLLCIRAGTDLAILNALPYMGPGQLGPRHHALLTSLLGALGIDSENIEVESKPFTWPMVTGLHVDNSPRAAATALLAYLQQKQSDWSFGKLLVMGEKAMHPVFTAVDDEEESSARPSIGQGKWKLSQTRSLDELLQHPELKKEAWKCIRTLLP
jgi:hypothetical protein